MCLILTKLLRYTYPLHRCQPFLPAAACILCSRRGVEGHCNCITRHTWPSRIQGYNDEGVSAQSHTGIRSRTQCIVYENTHPSRTTDSHPCKFRGSLRRPSFLRVPGNLDHHPMPNAIACSGNEASHFVIAAEFQSPPWHAVWGVWDIIGLRVPPAHEGPAGCDGIPGGPWP